MPLLCCVTCRRSIAVWELITVFDSRGLATTLYTTSSLTYIESIGHEFPGRYLNVHNTGAPGIIRRTVSVQKTLVHTCTPRIKSINNTIVVSLSYAWVVSMRIANKNIRHIIHTSHTIGAGHEKAELSVQFKHASQGYRYPEERRLLPV